MEITSYTQKSIILIGDNTIYYRDYIKEIGGKYNKKLKGWIFPSKYIDKVKQFLDDVNNNIIKKQSLPNYYKSNNEKDLNNKIESNINEDLTNEKDLNNEIESNINEDLNNKNIKNGYQIVNYIIKKPEIGMKIWLFFDNIKKEYEIKEIENNEGVIDTAYIKTKDNELLTKIVIINGKWKLLETSENHEIYF